jgi:hypothetical protein
MLIFGLFLIRLSRGIGRVRAQVDLASVIEDVTMRGKQLVWNPRILKSRPASRLSVVGYMSEAEVGSGRRSPEGINNSLTIRAAPCHTPCSIVS